jgi:hypothetical protein
MRGNLTGPGICLKVFVLLESAILILLEKDDKDLATANVMQLLKCLGYIPAIFMSIYNLERRKSKIIYGVGKGDICILLWLIITVDNNSYIIK